MLYPKNNSLGIGINGINIFDTINTNTLNNIEIDNKSMILFDLVIFILYIKNSII